MSVLSISVTFSSRPINCSTQCHNQPVVCFSLRNWKNFPFHCKTNLHPLLLFKYFHCHFIQRLLFVWISLSHPLLRAEHFLIWRSFENTWFGKSIMCIIWDPWDPKCFKGFKRVAKTHHAYFQELWKVLKKRNLLKVLSDKVAMCRCVSIYRLRTEDWGLRTEDSLKNPHKVSFCFLPTWTELKFL